MHMKRHPKQRLLVHVTNIPTPYRVAFCNSLHETLDAYGYGLRVLYCAEREPNRHWEVSFSDMAYPHELLPGISPKVGPLYAHFNPSIVWRLRQLRPQFLLIAGGWNMPTALLASGQVLCGSTFRVFWSEGHADAVLNPSGPIAWLRRRCLRAYNAFAIPNESSAHFLEMELGFHPTILPLPNTVDSEFYRTARTLEKDQMRKKLGLPLDTTIFVSVAQLDEHKGVRELVAAMLQLEAGLGHSMLALVGEGPLRGELEAVRRTEKADICLAGQQNAAGVRAYLAAADAFVLATKRDPNPLAVIEAAFAGLPLLVSHKAGNVRELVRDGFSGMVIPAIDSPSIAAVLARFCRLGEAERRRLGIGATELADAGFKREAVVQDFVAALLEHRTLHENKQCLHYSGFSSGLTRADH